MTLLVAWASAGAGQAVPTEPAATQPAAATPTVTATVVPTTTLPPRTTSTTVKAATTTVTTTVSAKSTTTTKPGPPTTTTTTTTVSPAEVRGMQGLANSVHRTPPSNNSALIQALAPLQAMGYTQQQALIVGMGQFPIAGQASWTDDWLEFRATPSPHNHEGIDLDAAMGTPIRSPIAGTLAYNDTDPDGYGMTAIVTGPDKTYYLLAHMSATVKTLSTGSAVTEGEVVGFIGATGDATGPHLHFEIHPNGGAGIDGKPILDGYMAAAIKAAPGLIASIKDSSTTTTTTVASTTPAPVKVAQPVTKGALSQPIFTRPAAARSETVPALTALGALLVCLDLAVMRYGFRPRSGSAEHDPPAPD
ncbi:MAG: M23 family metallopeptidase [Acidimicrobiales bacterium]